MGGCMGSLGRAGRRARHGGSPSAPAPGLPGCRPPRSAPAVLGGRARRVRVQVAEGSLREALDVGVHSVGGGVRLVGVGGPLAAEQPLHKLVEDALRGGRGRRQGIGGLRKRVRVENGRRQRSRACRRAPAAAPAPSARPRLRLAPARPPARPTPPPLPDARWTPPHLLRQVDVEALRGALRGAAVPRGDAHDVVALAVNAVDQRGACLQAGAWGGDCGALGAGGRERCSTGRGPWLSQVGRAHGRPRSVLGSPRASAHPCRQGRRP